MSSSEEQNLECPLCMEPLELDDVNFFPCTCGYQICRFCWHRIRTDGNGLCPACRKQYPEDPADFKPLSQEELQKIKNEKKQKDIKRKQKISESRKHLANVRVVQKNLVFVLGLPTRLSDAELLKKHDYFGKFGKILKLVVNNSSTYAGSQFPCSSAYVTYKNAEDALRAIQAISNIVIDGRTLKTSLGTTKYCSHFLKNQTCPKTDCMYLHDLGDEEASFTKEEMQKGKHQEYEKKLHEQILGSSTNNGSKKSTTNSSNKQSNKETREHSGKQKAEKLNGVSKSHHPQKKGHDESQANNKTKQGERNHKGSNREKGNSVQKGNHARNTNDTRHGHGNKSSNKKHNQLDDFSQQTAWGANCQELRPSSTGSIGSSTSNGSACSVDVPSSMHASPSCHYPKPNDKKVVEFPSQRKNSLENGPCQTNVCVLESKEYMLQNGMSCASPIVHNSSPRSFESEVNHIQEKNMKPHNLPLNCTSGNSHFPNDIFTMVQNRSIFPPSNHYLNQCSRIPHNSGAILNDSRAYSQMDSKTNYISSKMQEDELGFDPYSESSKGLADLLEKESELPDRFPNHTQPVPQRQAYTMPAHHRQMYGDNPQRVSEMIYNRVAPPPPGFGPHSHYSSNKNSLPYPLGNRKPLPQQQPQQQPHHLPLKYGHSTYSGLPHPQTSDCILPSYYAYHSDKLMSKPMNSVRPKSLDISYGSIWQDDYHASLLQNMNINFGSLPSRQEINNSLFANHKEL